MTSLQVHPDKLEDLRKALTRKGLTQRGLAQRADVSVGTVAAFMAGRLVRVDNFQRISQCLQLDWENLAGLHIQPGSPKDNVFTAREYIGNYIQGACGRIKVLDMEQDLGLTSLYVDTSVLTKISSRRGIGIDALRQYIRPGTNNLFQEFQTQDEPLAAMEAVERNHRLMIWGKPGSGKTTFLKYLSIQCIEGKIYPNLVPVFIEIDKYVDSAAEISLEQFIVDLLGNNNIAEDISKSLMQQGQLLILLDGLDEINEQLSTIVIRRIKHFLTSFSRNRAILTCRLGGQPYHPDFVEVEIADFEESQVVAFVEQWFALKEKPEKAKRFLARIETVALASIKELTNNPLLLTFLCLVFEECGQFSQNQFDLYRDAIDILLSKWDATRDKDRRGVYTKITPSHRRKLLGFVAYKTFVRGDYLFEKLELQSFVGEYIKNLPEFADAQASYFSNSDVEDILPCQAIIDSIESQNGLLLRRSSSVYSFSHLTIQEYFVARHIAYPSSPSEFELSLQRLSEKVFERRWHEVFLRLAERLGSSDHLLRTMLEKCHARVANNYGFRGYLEWVSKQSNNIVQLGYCASSVRAFYYDIDIDLDVDRKLGYLLDFKTTCVLTCASFLARAVGITMEETIVITQKYQREVDRISSVEPCDRDVAIFIMRILAMKILENEFPQSIDCKLISTIQDLKKQVPDGSFELSEESKKWWLHHGRGWSDQLRIYLVEQHLLRSPEWLTFLDREKELMRLYYEANLLIVECLQKSSLSYETRCQIESSILNPVLQVL
jgi:transcriptional regulator with XRE-family HTH domain